MERTDYKDLPCQCKDGGLKEHPDTGILDYVPNDGETGEKILMCWRCNCLTMERVYVHVDANLLGPKGRSGSEGMPQFRGPKPKRRSPGEVFNVLMESIGISGTRGPH